MKYRVKRFSQNLIGLQGGTLGIRRNKDGSTRKYDTDMDRFGRLRSAQSELRQIGSLDKELRKAQKELRNGNL